MGDMTIDELSRQSGVTTRNIRSYQTRGLLPPPRMAGRVGYYDDGHLARLRYVASLQGRGFSLAAIQCLLEAWDEGRELNDVLGFEQALTAPWTDEKPEPVTRERLEAMFPEVPGDPGLLERAVDLGLLEHTDGSHTDGSHTDGSHTDGSHIDGSHMDCSHMDCSHMDCSDFRAPSPRLLHVGAELVASGIPLAAALDEYERLTVDGARIAARLVALFEDNVWEPFVAAGMPPEALAGVTEALQRVRPMAAEAVDAVLARAMEAAVAASAARQMARFFQPAG